MKIINYNKGNYLSAFDCVIYGHIEMTQDEWKEARAYLRRVGRGDKMLKEDLTREDNNLKKYYDKKNTWLNVRVTYTEKLFKKFCLPRYKRQNYAIKILNK